jgi:uncharacterized membrane protein YoaK (UPF0700 family)
MPYRRSALRRAPRQERPGVFAGAIGLSAMAGYINVVALGFFHVPVSHMTGAASRLSIDIATRDLADLVVVLSIIAGFLAGAVLSGAIIGGRKLAPGRRYGVVLLLEGVVLAGSALLLRHGQATGVTLAAMACGLQNAMASSYYGLVIRTTHVTGIVTDIGVMLGHLIRHRRVHTWQMLLLFSLLAGFFGGGIAGALAYRAAGVAALFAASAGCMVAGATYYVWRARLRRPPLRTRAQR